jgi:hypothetical protein
MYADTMTKRLPSMADIANTAVFLASDLAAAITGITVDATCGTTAGLNYRAGGAADGARTGTGDISPVIHQGSSAPS